MREPEPVVLRGHHLLCLLGYRGMGYSEAFTENMTRVYHRLLSERQTAIKIIEGADDLCACYPNDGTSHCCSVSVGRRDDSILRVLGLRPGGTYVWHEILQLVRSRVRPENIAQWCGGCPWEPYGVCKEGVALVCDGQDLPAIDTGKKRDG